MPKIRKKTSNRVGTYQREKVKKKISEAKKKAKKVAKHDVTWKSNKPEKDLGIPSKFPFKDQILAEAAELKVKREEDKKLAREKQKAAHQAASLGLPDPGIAALAASSNPYATLEAESGEEDDDDDNSDNSADSEDDGEGGISASLRLHAKSLREVISKSDVIIQVLDARDPEGTRSRKIEKEAVQVHGKKLIMVLNKIDLVPKENVEAWLKHLRYSFPTLAFKSSTQSQRKNLSSSATSSHTPAGASSTSPAPLLTLLKNYSRAGSLTIGVIGFPNVGKSSLINTLKRSKACGVAPTPGFTKQVQIVSLDGSLKIFDCPGVVYEGGDQSPESVLRNCTAVEQVDDPMAPVDVILRKCKKEHLMMLYNIPFFSETKDFMIAVARSRGRLKKGGIPDLSGAARMVLRDWNAGRIPYYTVPPATPSGPKYSSSSSSTAPGAQQASLLTSSENIGSAAIVDQLAPEFDLDNLFKEADSFALQDVKSSKDMAPGSMVKLNESISSMTIDQEDALEGEMRLMGESADARAGVIDEEEDVPMLVPVAPKKKGKKRQASEEASTTISLPPSNKQKKVVSFESSTGSKKENAASQKAKMFADAPEEAPIQLNKDIKQQAKKDKKKKAKAGRVSIQDIEAVDDTPIVNGGPKQAVDPDKPQPYDFSKFFSAPAPKKVSVRKEDTDM